MNELGKEEEAVWISMKKYRALEKRIADLEVRVRGQQQVANVISTDAPNICGKVTFSGSVAL